MDGSMGFYLLSKGVPKDTQIWSARGIVEEKYHPLVVEAHADYIRAGATIITTNNYGIQPAWYQAVFEDWKTRIPADTMTSVRLAREARKQCGAEGAVKIFGSLPPLCQTFRPDLTREFIEKNGEEACVNFYKEIAGALVRGGVDGLLGETLNGWEEARFVVEAAKDLKVPIILSFDGSFRTMDLKAVPKQLAPQAAKEVVAAKRAGAPILAMCMNCAPPEETLEALQAIASSGVGAELRAADVQLAVYANCNDTREYHEKGFDLDNAAEEEIVLRKDCTPTGYPNWAKKFADAGATYCGGCCGTTPDHIKKLAELFSGSACCSSGDCGAAPRSKL